MSEKSIFAKNLVRARKQRGLKQHEVASAIFKSLKAYQKYEEGKAEADHATLLHICRVFEIDDLHSFLFKDFSLLKNVG
jgi:transcriptional regulator with XRE-family HTH domain